jgi:hypothetical protein
MRIQLRSLYESEGYRVESVNTDPERAQVTLRWDERRLPRCGECGQRMRINRKTRQGAMDLPLGPASFVLVVYEAVQGYGRHCRRYETVRPLQIVEQHTATLRLLRHISLLCRWLPVQRVCQLVPIAPMTAYRDDRYILQTELPAPQLGDIKVGEYVSGSMLKKSDTESEVVKITRFGAPMPKAPIPASEAKPVEK